MEGNINIIFRESTFLSNSAKNNRGHEIYTIQNDNGSPAISMINAYFDNPKKDNSFVEYDKDGNNRTAEWKTCTSSTRSLCTEIPFTVLVNPMALQKKSGSFVHRSVAYTINIFIHMVFMLAACH